MSLGAKLLELRVRDKMSLQEVAKAVGISKAHVWNLEKGLSDNPSMELLVKLADLFRVRVADLIGEDPGADAEEPEMVAMFRNFKELGQRDRETIRVLVEQLRRKKEEGD